jgi:hypothetical protein
MGLGQGCRRRPQLGVDARDEAGVMVFGNLYQIVQYCQDLCIDIRHRSPPYVKTQPLVAMLYALTRTGQPF